MKIRLVMPICSKLVDSKEKYYCIESANNRKYRFKILENAMIFNAKKIDRSLKVHQSIPIIGFILCLISCVGMLFDPNQAPALYFGLPFAAIALLYYFVKFNKKRGV